ncbi:MAG: RlmE family RNA methyltransferase [Desulfatiglans sp.]|nr:RlmE family RNA methyltransferase [Thermodesulfobacteriota bacterium]MEE4352969.1 RlmE family RNA methyltransferase [Desulfatiglans sp.]
MKGNRWDDHFARRAREEKRLARSVYKLQEIQKKYKVIVRGNRVLDLGCYPGSWSQYAIEKAGSRGEVVGIDLDPPARLSSPSFRFIQKDLLTLDKDWLAREIGPMDLVMSDLAPKTTGSKSTDAARSMALAEKAWDIASALLKEEGHFISKVFEGEDLRSYRSNISAFFRKTRILRPQATRKKSREVYVIGLSRIA